MTSNVGSNRIQELQGDREAIEKAVHKLLAQQFRPEFLNRIDASVVFESLTKPEIRQIVDLEMERVRMQLHEHEIELVEGVDSGFFDRPGPFTEPGGFASRARRGKEADGVRREISFNQEPEQLLTDSAGSAEDADTV